MSRQDETFFTSIGCMDGRVQEPVLRFGQEKFGARFTDTITEAGLVGQLSKKTIDERLLKSLREKINISLKKHQSKGIVVHGHQECAASDAVADEVHKDDIRRTVTIIESFIDSSTPVFGVFVKRSNDGWIAEEVSQTLTA